MLLHKGGPTADPNNWRPIAILSISYKIFARCIYHRIRRQLDHEQSDEQFGFRSERSTVDALIIAEEIVSKSIEYNTELWMVSVDLRKAFDRVEHGPLFASLRLQGLEEAYCQLLENIYSDQCGVLRDDLRFPIGRGVRQGDVLSPPLFNSVLEMAIRKWKRGLTDQGIALTANVEEARLTNIRFADDLLVFANSMGEATYMLDGLVTTLREFGLELNVKKTKLMSTVVSGSETTLVETNEGFIELVPAGHVHKYLGRGWSGKLTDRGQAAVGHRISCAWAKFRSLQPSLLNKNVNIKLRLSLFDATVSASLMYGLETCPLTWKQLDRLDVIQREMFRKMVGWRIYSEDLFEESGRRMKLRLERALALRPVATWSGRILRKKEQLSSRLSSGDAPMLSQKAFNWNPPACSHLNRQNSQRKRGHPRQRWTDLI